jgi:hypothetical protein
VADEGATQPVEKLEARPPACIYFILDHKAAAGFGHAATIICDGTGYFYYSYGPVPKYGATGLLTGSFPTLSAALAYAKSGDAINKYTYEEHWYITEAEAARARAAAAAYAGTEYHPTTHSCWSMVYAALHAAGTNAIDWSVAPNINFDKNRPLADGSSKL